MSDVEKNIGTHKPEFDGEWVRLGDVCAKGKSNLRQKDLKNDGPYPVYGASGIVGFSSDYQNAEAYVAVVKDGAGVGRVMACEPRSSVLGTMQALLPGKGTERDYLLHLVRSMDLGKGFTGSTIPHIYFKDYGKTLVRALSREQQVEVANRLSGIDRLISQGKQQLSFLDDLVKSQFVEMFERREYPVIRLGDGVKRMHIGPFGSALKSDCFCDEVSADCVVYEQRHAIHSAFATEYRYINKNKHEELKRFEVGPGDLIISCRGTIGKVAVIPEDAPRGIIHPSLMLVSVDDAKYDVEFFRRMLIDVLGSLEQRAKGNCVKMAVKASELEEIKVPLPPLALQQQFADFVAKVDKLGFDCCREIVCCDALFSSISASLLCT